MPRLSETTSLDLWTIVPEAADLDCDFPLADPFGSITNEETLLDECPVSGISGLQTDTTAAPNVATPVTAGGIGPELQDESVANSPHKAFACVEPGCGKAFYRQSELRKHKKTHADEAERPHQCQKCSKRFLYGKDVRRHVLSKHRNADENLQKHYCDYPACGKSFYRRDKLLRHKQKQHIEKEMVQQRKSDSEMHDLGLGAFDNTDYFTSEKDDEGNAIMADLSGSIISIDSLTGEMADSIYSNFSFSSSSDLGAFHLDSFFAY